MALCQTQLRPNPFGHLLDGGVCFRRSSGEELEHVLHVGVQIDLDFDACGPRPIDNAKAVVQKCLGVADRNVDWREAGIIGVERIGERMLLESPFGPMNNEPSAFVVSRETSASRAALVS
jgi:hypothetical protein